MTPLYAPALRTRKADSAASLSHSRYKRLSCECYQRGMTRERGQAERRRGVPHWGRRRGLINLSIQPWASRFAHTQHFENRLERVFYFAASAAKFWKRDISSAFASCSHAWELAADLPHQDHVWIATNNLFRFHNNEFDEIPCKLDSTEYARSFRRYPTLP